MNGVELIAQERERQRAKGYDESHDFGHHDDGSLVGFAGMLISAILHNASSDDVEPPADTKDWVTPAVCHVLDKWTDPLDRLRIVGALVAAEMDRLLTLRGERDDRRPEMTSAEFDALMVRLYPNAAYPLGAGVSRPMVALSVAQQLFLSQAPPTDDMRAFRAHVRHLESRGWFDFTDFRTEEK